MGERSPLQLKDVSEPEREKQNNQIVPPFGSTLFCEKSRMAAVVQASERN